MVSYGRFPNLKSVVRFRVRIPESAYILDKALHSHTILEK